MTTIPKRDRPLAGLGVGELAPAPTLKRPVVMITGLFMPASSYDPLAKNLARNPDNGPVAVYRVSDGKFHRGSCDGPVMNAAELRNTKIFEVQYTNVVAGPTSKRPEVAQAMRAIQRATGTKEVDVVCHSAGGTDFRLYLQERSAEEKKELGFHGVTFIGPATQGTFVGNFGGAASKVLKLPIVAEKLGVGFADPTPAAKELAYGSPLIERLNLSWDAQRAQISGGVNVIALTATVPTTKNKDGKLVKGDGFMPLSEVSLPGGKTVEIVGFDPTPAQHILEVYFPAVVDQVQMNLMSEGAAPSPLLSETAASFDPTPDDVISRGERTQTLSNVQSAIAGTKERLEELDSQYVIFHWWKYVEMGAAKAALKKMQDLEDALIAAPAGAIDLR